MFVNDLNHCVADCVINCLNFTIEFRLSFVSLLKCFLACSWRFSEKIWKDFWEEKSFSLEMESKYIRRDDIENFDPILKWWSWEADPVAWFAGKTILENICPTSFNETNEPGMPRRWSNLRLNWFYKKIMSLIHS